MLYLIEPHNYDAYREDLDNMYRFRHRIFFDKLNWDVNSQDDMEKDEYDEKETYYLIYKDEEGIIRGCVRFIEMINNCMFDGPFKDALPNVKEFKRQGYWEITRFAVDTNPEYYKLSGNRNIAKIIWAGIIKFAIKSKRVECYMATTYLAFKKLSERYGLLIYDVNKKKFEESQMYVWGFSSMKYSWEKLKYNSQSTENVDSFSFREKNDKKKLIFQ